MQVATPISCRTSKRTSARKYEWIEVNAKAEPDGLRVCRFSTFSANDDRHDDRDRNRGDGSVPIVQLPIPAADVRQKRLDEIEPPVLVDLGLQQAGFLDRRLSSECGNEESIQKPQRRPAGA